jgi:hypothetical protein
MMEISQTVFFVNFANLVDFVRNLHFQQGKLEAAAGSHKIHKARKVHKVVGDGTPSSR